MIDDEKLPREVSMRERHKMRLVALLTAPALLFVAVLYARALTATFGAHFGLDIIRANGFIIGVVFTLLTLVIALRFVFFVRMPFKLMWASSLVAALFVGLFVAFTTAIGAGGDPMTRALDPLHALVGDVGDAVRQTGVSSGEPTMREPISDEPVMVPTTDDDERTSGQPVSPNRRGQGDYEWAWTDRAGNFHVTSSPPPDGAQVLSKTRRK
jgi:hypothetical protein